MAAALLLWKSRIARCDIPPNDHASAIGADECVSGLVKSLRRELDLCQPDEFGNAGTIIKCQIGVWTADGAGLNPHSCPPVIRTHDMRGLTMGRWIKEKLQEWLI